MVRNVALAAEATTMASEHGEAATRAMEDDLHDAKQTINLLKVYQVVVDVCVGV